MTRGIYPGSFDPVTFGHIDIIQRSSRLVDELIVGVLINSAKNPLFSVEERVSILKEVLGDIPNLRIETFGGLLVEFAQKTESKVIIRGLRAITDFEYELQIAQTNHIINREVDTIFLNTNLEYAYLSSTIVKEVASYGGDISHFVPEYVVDKLYDKYNIKK